MAMPLTGGEANRCGRQNNARRQQGITCTDVLTTATDVLTELRWVGAMQRVIGDLSVLLLNHGIGTSGHGCTCENPHGLTCGQSQTRRIIACGNATDHGECCARVRGIHAQRVTIHCAVVELRGIILCKKVFGERAAAGFAQGRGLNFGVPCRQCGQQLLQCSLIIEHDWVLS